MPGAAAISSETSLPPTVNVTDAAVAPASTAASSPFWTACAHALGAAPAACPAATRAEIAV